MTLEDFQDSDYLDLLPTGLLVPHYLIHCYLYYEASESVISDTVFDRLARRLYDEWEDAKGHPHAHLIDPNALRSGGNYIKHVRRTKQAAAHLLGRTLFSR
jgi:NAD-dependent DNA ligase